jgi:hypothetical protein
VAANQRTAERLAEIQARQTRIRQERIDGMNPPDAASPLWVDEDMLIAEDVPWLLSELSVVQARAGKMQEALEAIVEEDELVEANEGAFALYAFRRCQRTARWGLDLPMDAAAVGRGAEPYPDCRCVTPAGTEAMCSVCGGWSAGGRGAEPDETTR